MRYKHITIKKRQDCSTYYARYRKNGKQYYFSGRTVNECLNKLKRAYNDETFGTSNISKSIKLIEWYEKWLALYKTGKVKETTLLDYKQILKNISGKLLNKEIINITVADVLTALNEIPGERSRQKAYDLLNMLFVKAEVNDIVARSIFYKIEKPKHSKEHGIALTQSQYSALESACRNLKYGDYFLVCLYQGMRRGECLALTIDDLDFENKTININKAINHYNKLDTTKNKQSMRITPMFDSTKNILLKYKNLNPGQQIFDVSYNWLDVVLNEIINKVGFKFSIKDLRSSFITHCKDLNIPEHIIQSWVGHQIGSKVTAQVYTKHNADVDIKYINILNSEKKSNSNRTHTQ